jgi:hypothetical protein
LEHVVSDKLLYAWKTKDSVYMLFKVALLLLFLATIGLIPLTSSAIVFECFVGMTMATLLC